MVYYLLSTLFVIIGCYLFANWSNLLILLMIAAIKIKNVFRILLYTPIPNELNDNHKCCSININMDNNLDLLSNFYIRTLKSKNIIIVKGITKHMDYYFGLDITPSNLDYWQFELHITPLIGNRNTPIIALIDSEITIFDYLSIHTNLLDSIKTVVVNKHICPIDVDEDGCDQE